MTSGAEQTRREPSAVVLCIVAYLAAAAAAVGVAWALAAWHPIWVVAVADIAATLVVFGFSVAVNNTSMYDPYWSVAPPVIAAYWAFGAAGQGDPVRRVVLLALVTLWAVRLTAHWLRRWRGLSHEDWRYADMRPKAGRAFWLVSLLGFHLMPTLVVFVGCLPLLPALGSPQPFDALDAAAGVIIAAAIVIETVADEQLHRFGQTSDASERTLATGLWARCRHPNYLGEILFWWGLFLAALMADPTSLWTGVGAVVMTLLFVYISVPLIDQRMLARRPDYREHMKRAPALLPRWPRR